MQKVKKAVLQYFAWLLVSGALVWYIAGQYSTEEKTLADPAGEVAVRGIERLWVDDSGRFIGEQVDGRAIRTLVIQPENGKTKASGVQIAAWTLPDDETLAAVGPNARAIAIVSGHQLSTLDGDGKTTLSRTLDGADNAIRLAWSSSGLITVLDTGGSITCYEAKTLKDLGSTAASVEAADTLVVNSAFIAVGNSATGDVRVFDTRALPRIHLVETRKLQRKFWTVALSAEGRLAIGADDGPILAEKSLQSAGAVHAITFDGRGRLVTAGDFEGVMLTDGIGEPIHLSKTPKGTTAVAATFTHVAYAGKNGARILSVHVIPAMNGTAKGLVKIWIAINLAILVAYLIRALMTLWSALKKRDDRFTLGRGIGGSLGEMDPPEDLLSAIRDRECVLVVGEDLSSASSLPSWPQFVRRLAAWMIDLDLLPSAEAVRVRKLLDAGKMEEAIIVLREHISNDRLHEFARGTYVRPAPVSSIHEKLATVPFAAALDGCLDQLFERALGSPSVLIPAQSEHARTALAAGGWFGMKLRGDWARPESIVVDPGAAANLNRQQPGYLDVFKAVFEKRTVLFAGASLREIGTWVEALRATRLQPRTHYALVAEPGSGSNRAAESLCRKHQIKVLTYTHTDSAQVCRFLDKLRVSYQSELRAKVAGGAA